MREILVLPGSLRRDIMGDFSQWADRLNPREDQILLLQNLEEAAQLSHRLTAYQELRNGLWQRGITTRTVAEDSMACFLLERNCDKPLYTTPLHTASDLVALAAACGYSGDLYVLGRTAADPPVRNLRPLIRAFLANPQSGTKTLPKEKVLAAHTPGSRCHYMIQGCRIEQILAGSADRGAEGYLLQAAASGYCLKIWDRSRFVYVNEKLEEMFRMEDNPEMALPLGFVYNEQEEPIGIVMRYFAGKTVSLDQLICFPEPFKLCEDILRQMIFLESCGVEHMDLWHNITIDDTGAHIIDLDSAQFAGYPATAESKEVYIPRRFGSGSAFGNGISASYLGLAMLIQLYLDRAEYNALLWDSANRRIAVNPDKLQKLPPPLQAAVLQAYQREKPVSLLRQLRLVEELQRGSMQVETPPSTPAPQSKLVTPKSDPAPQPQPVAPKSEHEPESQPVTSKNRPEPQPAPVPPKNRPEPPAHPTDRTRRSTAEEKPWLVQLVQQFIIWICGGISGTLPRSYDKPVDLWEVFLDSGVWKGPLAISAACLGVMVLLILAIVLL